MSEQCGRLVAVAAALAGAVAAVAAGTTAGTAVAANAVKCFGVAKAGENGCADAARPGGATHSCAGQSGRNYDGHEWQVVRAGTAGSAEDVCMARGGSLTPFDGQNPKHPE